jgi:hypothetical protein
MNVISEETVYVDIESAGFEFTRPIIQIAAIAVDSSLCRTISVRFSTTQRFPRSDNSWSAE